MNYVWSFVKVISMASLIACSMVFREVARPEGTSGDIRNRSDENFLQDMQIGTI